MRVGLEVSRRSLGVKPQRSIAIFPFIISLFGLQKVDALKRVKFTRGNYIIWR